MAAFQWGPLSRRQKQVLSWWRPGSPVADYDGIIADGAIRSGKTVCMSLSFVLWAMACFEGQNFAICGKTLGSLRRNVIGPLTSMLQGRNLSVIDHRTDNRLEVSAQGRTNRFYLFGGKDERSQDFIQGITLAGVFCDEVALMPQSFVSQATARCSVEGSKLWFNCNPDGPYHWFYRSWITQCRRLRLVYLHFTMEDNLSLSEEVKARYRRQYTGVFYRRYILGQWAAAEGLVYHNFDREKNVVSRLPDCCAQPRLGGGRYYISVDYGTRNPFSAGLWCVYEGTATRIREYYHDGRKQEPRTDEEHYRALVELAGEFPVEKLVIDPSAASMMETIRRHGRFRVRAARNQVAEGIADVTRLLAQGKLKIHESCTDCLREFASYRWDEKASEDRVIKENDHAMDDIRYFVRTILRKGG